MQKFINVLLLTGLIAFIWGVATISSYGIIPILIGFGCSGIYAIIMIATSKRGYAANLINEREQANKELKQCNPQMENYSTLFLSDRSQYLNERLAKEPYMIKNYKGERSKLVFRSATVGGITTGGFSEEGGGYRVKERKSDRFILVYYDISGGNRKRCEINKIKMSPSLLEKAKKDPFISKYIKNDMLVVVEDSNLSSGSVAAMQFGQKVGNYDMAWSQISAEKAADYPTEGKIDSIMRFLCQTD